MYLSPYMKYAATGGPARESRAQTYLYIPYWGHIPLTKGASAKFPDTDQGEDGINLAAPDMRFFPNYDDDPTTPELQQSKTRLAFPQGFPPPDLGSGDADRFLDCSCNPFADMNMYSITAPWGKSRPTVANHWVTRICKIRSTSRGILGVNLFTNAKPSDGVASRFPNPGKLAMAHKRFSREDAGASAWPEPERLDDHSQATPTLLLVACGRDVCGDPATVTREVQRLERKYDTYDLDGDGITDPEPISEVEEDLRAAYIEQSDAGSSGAHAVNVPAHATLDISKAHLFNLSPLRASGLSGFSSPKDSKAPDSPLFGIDDPLFATHNPLVIPSDSSSRKSNGHG